MNTLILVKNSSTHKRKHTHTHTHTQLNLSRKQTETADWKSSSVSASIYVHNLNNEIYKWIRQTKTTEHSEHVTVLHCVSTINTVVGNAP